MYPPSPPISKEMGKIDLDSTNSELKGLKGLFEKILRRFKTVTHLFTMLPVYAFGVLIIGFSRVPGVYAFRWASEYFSEASVVVQNISLALSLSLGYFLYGTTLIFLAPLVNFIFRAKLKPWRGQYHSFETLKWFFHNGLTYIARYTFLEFVTPSPVNLLFYRMMGMKIGRGAVINTTFISDPSLIELGEKVTIGGSVTLVAHYGQGGMMVIAPVVIGKGTTVGLKATIMGGVEIGENVKILPHSVILPKTKIPSGETWGGVPAKRIEYLRNAIEQNRAS